MLRVETPADRSLGQGVRERCWAAHSEELCPPGLITFPFLPFPPLQFLAEKTPTQYLVLIKVEP